VGDLVIDKNREHVVEEFNAFDHVFVVEVASQVILFLVGHLLFLVAFSTDLYGIWPRLLLVLDLEAHIDSGVHALAEFFAQHVLIAKEIILTKRVSFEAILTFLLDEIHPILTPCQAELRSSSRQASCSRTSRCQTSP